MKNSTDLPPHKVGETLIGIGYSENSRDNTMMDITCTGFYKKDKGSTGIVNMEIRLSDNESEGNYLFIDVQNELDNMTGNYAPFTFEKDDLRKFIDYLEQCYTAL